MSADITEAKVRQQIYTYLEDTLHALPPKSTFSITSDSNRGTVGPGGTSVCSDSAGATAKDTPVSVLLYYWLNGTPRGQEQHYFEKIEKIWHGWGWKKQNDATASATSSTWNGPDGFALSVKNAANGPGGVSVAATSPCFWSRNDAVVGPKLAQAQPRTIE